MASISTARLATCVVAATLVSAAAATLPTEALADDGPASVPATPVGAPSLDTGAVLAGEASAAVEGAIGDTVDAVAQATEQPAPAEATPTAESTPATPVETVPTPEVAPVEEPSTPDTTAISPDTAAGIATPAPAVAPTTTTTVQASPTNVNVSVRVGSPGDNGPVTQVNVAAAFTSGASAGSGTSTASATPVAPTSTTSTAAPPASQSAAGSPTSAQDDPDTWTWQWNCLSKPDLSVISPGGPTTGSVPRNWTWIWNCGNNPTQYQDATTSQYQPSNVNISIRISSPGNDGPVSQANVAVAAAVGSIVAAQTPVGSVVAIPAPAPVSNPVSDVIPGMTSLPTSLPALAEQVAPIWLGDDSSVPSVVELVDDTVELPFGLAPLFRGVASGSDEGQTGAPAARGLAVPAIGRLSPIGTLGAAPGAYEAVQGVASAGGRSAESGEPASRAARKPVPRWHAPLPQPMPAGTPSGASFAPATGGSSSGGGIPIFLVLPFLAAMLDLARRVPLDRAALPSGHRSRMPDDPG
jgi:hypothetical protein